VIDFVASADSSTRFACCAWSHSAGITSERQCGVWQHGVADPLTQETLTTKTTTTSHRASSLFNNLRTERAQGALTRERSDDKRVWRLYKMNDLSVRKRRKARRINLERVPLLASQHVNDTWSADFVMDALANGRRIKCLTVVDDFSRENVDIAQKPASQTENTIQQSRREICRLVPRYTMSNRSSNRSLIQAECLLDLCVRPAPESTPDHRRSGPAGLQ
jgi:hypothetical protein